ncbi:MAG TPA: MMPL family transporter [Solirubrobacteraceae bacterium]|nr:MMPL family transporter [Solirubrobacteraceae bacterium]
MRGFERIARASARRPGRVLAAVALLAVAGSLLALRLEPSAATETLVGRGADTYEATERYRERFGDHSVVVLVRGELPDVLLTSNLGRLIGLEGCLSGNKPEGETAPGGRGSPCDRLAELKPVQVVYGPGTFANASAGEIRTQIQAQSQAKAAEATRAARAARKVAKAQGKSRAEQQRVAASARQLVYAGFVRDLLQINLRYGLGLTGLPSVDDPNFVSALYFDPSRGATTPKARFAYLLPSAEAAVVQVRLKPDLSDEQRAEAVALVREAVRMPQWDMKGDATYTVTGAPVVAEDLADALAGSTLRLLLIGLVLMAVVLALVFRSRLRLVPLAVALAAVAVTFGGMSLLGAPLTMASIATLPVLLGLGVDYAIQYQARVEEEGDAPRAARVAGPVIATAALATGVGFLVLLLSPVPMVRSFGLLLVAGIGIAFALALTAGTAALSLGRGGTPGDGPLARSLRGAGELLEGPGRALGRPARRAGGAAVRTALRRPGRVLVVGLALAAAGWAVDSRTEVVSDIERLVPQDLRAVEDLQALQEATGVAGEVDVVVEGADLTQPAVVRWMRAYQSAVLRRYGYSAERGCARAELCPALSLSDLFRSEQAAGDRERIRALLDAVPPYFSRAVITEDRRTAALAFGIRLVSLERQQEIIEDLRDRLDPPAGVTARLAGLPVLAAEANANLSDPLRRLATLLLGLLAVLGVLLVVGRRRVGSWRGAWQRAWVPLVPIALATGWSALVLFLLRVPLNPLSAALGALVLAISTEFAVLLSARFEAERAAGFEPAEALRRTYRSTGAAVLASGSTAIAGFAVLALSDVRMLRDFGLVTVVDLTVSLLGVLAVLPAVLVLAERRAAVRAVDAPAAPALPASG